MIARPDILAFDGFMEQLRRIRDASAAGREAALLHLSIDHFRSTLRTYPGRTDAVLQQLTTMLHAATQGKGMVGELGWGEFGIVAATEIRPTDLAQALVQQIARTDFAQRARASCI